MDDFENYEPRSPEVTRVGDGWFEAWLGEDVCRPGTAVRVYGPDDQTVIGRTLDHRGGATIGAQLLNRPSWLESGQSVEPLGSQTAFPPPEDATLDLTEASFRTEDDASLRFEFPDIPFSAYDSRRPAVATGHTGIDLLSPVAAGGTTLILDNGPAASGSVVVDALSQTALEDEADSPASTMLQGLQRLELISPGTPRWWHQSADSPNDDWRSVVVEEDSHSRWMGFRAATSWIAELRSQHHPTLFVADLPPLREDRPASGGRSRPGRQGDDDGLLESIAVDSLLNRLSEALASTTEAAVSSIFRLPIRHMDTGAQTIIETLPMGDLETVIFVDDTGCFDPKRSSSDAVIPDDDWQRRRNRAFRALQTTRDLEEKRRIQGPDALTDGERQAVSLLEGLSRPLSD